MVTMTITDARASLADVVDRVRIGHEPIYLTRRGKPVAALIDAERLDALLDTVARVSPAAAEESDDAVRAMSVTQRLNAAWAADPERDDMSFATWSVAQARSRVTPEEW